MTAFNSYSIGEVSALLNLSEAGSSFIFTDQHLPFIDSALMVENGGFRRIVKIHLPVL